MCTMCYIMATNQPIAEALKTAIEESGLPFLALEQQTGVTRQSLMSFLKGERTLRLDIADKLAVYFGLELLPSTKSKRSRKGK